MTNSQPVENETAILAELARIEAELRDRRLADTQNYSLLDRLNARRRQYRNLLLAQAYGKRYPN